MEFERLFGLSFLQKAERGVDDHHAGDDRGVEPQSQHELDEAGGEQNIDEDVVELLQEAHQWPALRALGKAIGAVLGEASRRFSGGEALRGIALETTERLVGLQRVPMRRGGEFLAGH